MKNCNCIKNVSATIVAKQNGNEQRPAGFKIMEACFKTVSIFPRARMFSEFEIEYTFIKKDGSESKSKKQIINVFFSFCPFCGKEIKSDK